MDLLDDELSDGERPEILIFCPCSEPVNDVVDVVDVVTEDDEKSLIPSTILDENTLHPISNLWFCSTCCSIRCRKCLEPEVECKFCPHCMLEMKLEYSYCSGNCFNCPRCYSSLNITFKDHKDNEGQLIGKSFGFTCPNQQDNESHWSYNTGIVEKPRSSLSKIIRSQVREFYDGYKIFNDLTSYYLKLREINKYDLKKRTNMINSRFASDVDVISNIGPLELAKLTSRKSTESNEYRIPNFNPIKYDLNSDLEKIDIVSSKTDYRSIELLENSNRIPMNNIESSKSQQKENLFPLHQKLRSKISLRCKKCRDQIMKPDSDPISTKFYKSNNATTVLPFIQISPLLNNLYNNKFIPNSKVQLLMSFINYSPQEMEISISSLDKLSLTKNFTETTSLSDNFIKINLPCSSFKLKQQPKNPLKLENLITTIPTVELNNYSRLSRTELINRNKVIKRLSTPSTGNSQTVPLDSGINWCTIPLELSIGDLSQNLNQYKTQLKIPFFISIKQKQTENIEQAFGIWIIAKLGYIEA